MMMTHTENWYFWFTFPFLVLLICSRWLKLIQPRPSCRVKSVRLDFYLPANNLKHLFVCHAKKGPTLRTPRVGQHASPALAAIATNLNGNHVHQRQIWNVKNAASVLQASGRWNLVEEQETLFVRNARSMDRGSWATLACSATKLGLKVIVSNSLFHKKDSVLKKLATAWKLVTLVKVRVK